MCVLPWSDALPLFCCSAFCSRQITQLQQGGLPVPLTGHDSSHTEIHPRLLSPVLFAPHSSLFCLSCVLLLTLCPPSLVVLLYRFHHDQLQSSRSRPSCRALVFLNLAQYKPLLFWFWEKQDSYCLSSLFVCCFLWVFKIMLLFLT